jgi:hypothetical protein
MDMIELPPRPGYVLTRVNEHIRDMYGGYLAG